MTTTQNNLAGNANRVGAVENDWVEFLTSGEVAMVFATKVGTACRGGSADGGQNQTLPSGREWKIGFGSGSGQKSLIAPAESGSEKWCLVSDVKVVASSVWDFRPACWTEKHTALFDKTRYWTAAALAARATLIWRNVR